MDKSVGRRAAAVAIVITFVGALCGLAPSAAGASAASAPPPTAIHIGAKIPIVLDPSPAPPTQVRASSRRAAAAPSANSTTTTISVTYTGFSADAKASFQRAVDIWKGLISSTVPIKINASWTALGTGILGSAGPDEILHDTPGTVANTWYPVALANALAGTDLDTNHPDIDAQFSSAYSSWYFGTGLPAAGQIDFESVVLHELGHGLGFYGLGDVGSNGHGTFLISGEPGIFDRFTRVGSMQVTSYTNDTTTLGAALQGSNLRFYDTLTNAAAGSSGARLYAPASWEEGSSYSHLDEATYPAGNANSLMTPMIGAQESIHDPGPITMAMFADMGWPTVSAQTAPAAPTGVTASPLSGASQIAFTPAAGTAAGSTYTVSSTPSSAGATGSASPITVSGLTNGTSYTFTVTATSTAGTGPASAASNAVTPLALPGDTPAITAPLNGASTTDLVTLSATSPDAAVRFDLDGTTLGNPVAVVGGTASTTWQSHGTANGSHTIAAHSCASTGAWSCTSGAGLAASVTVTVTNTTPVLTAPTPNRVASGTLKMAATADGAGGVAFLVNGVRKAFDATSPYTASVAVDKLADGTYTATAQSCDVAGTTCESVASTPVTFKVKNLHPTLTSVTSSPFSPNGDGFRDSVSIGYSLPDTETATWRITGPSGTVKDETSLGTLAKGARTLTWNGKSTAGAVVPDGTYTIILSTSATVSGRKLVGRATKSVVVDRTAPQLTSVTGDGTTFYSSGGGTPGSFTTKVTLDEPGAITETIRNSTGGLVQTLIAAGIAGKTSVTWNGKSSAGALVTSGTYTWRLKVVDAAGNARNGGPYTVKLLHLAARSTHLQLNGNQSYGVFTTDTSCAGYNPDESTFPNGTWIDNECPTSSAQAIEARYQFTAPAAYSYQSVTIVASAYTDFSPSQAYGAVNAPGGWAGGPINITATTPASINLGTYSITNSVDASHHLLVAVGVDNVLGSPSDLDINWVNIAVSYTVKL